MTEFIAQITFFSSFLGMALILIKKFPVFKVLENSESQNPNLTTQEKTQKPSFLNLWEVFKSNFGNLFLQKLLSRIKIISLKIETKCGYWLQGLREKSTKEKESQTYWEKIRKFSVKHKSSSRVKKES